MYTDELLTEKYRVQAEIARKNDYDLNKMAAEALQTVAELATRLNIQVEYFTGNNFEKTV